MAAPKREVFKAADVCQVAGLQPYVLRSWEAEFPGLGTGTRGGSRLYGPSDLDLVLRIKALVYEEGLTLAGARRRLEDPPGAGEPASDRLVVLDETARATIAQVRAGLSDLLAMLNAPAAGQDAAPADEMSGDAAPAGTRGAPRRRVRATPAKTAHRDVAQPG